MSQLGEIRDTALPLAAEADLDPLLERIGSARYVLIGEGSHGSHEYYAWRAALSRRLIAEHGFSFVAVEGDWPACWKVNRSVTLAAGVPDDPGAVLDAERRWPSWIWSNEETVRFTRWLRGHNAGLPDVRRVGWYGLEVYPLWETIRSVVAYLVEHCPAYVDVALDPRRADVRLVPDEHTGSVLKLLAEPYRSATVPAGADRWQRFAAEQYAGLAAGAEEFFGAMLAGGTASWNARDAHLTDTLDRLREFHGPEARGIVWAHNLHCGDARGAGDMQAAGMVSIGQLVRERHGADAAFSVGFAGGGGEVIAVPRRGLPMRPTQVPRPRPGSLEAAFADTGSASALYLLGAGPGSASGAPGWASADWAHRNIGVVYDPDRDAERFEPTRPARRYDALCWFDRITPVRALHLDAARRGELETFPST